MASKYEASDIADNGEDDFPEALLGDFDTSRLAGLAPVAERRDGKFIYRSDRGTGLRIGAGGPELLFETLNGDIRILQRD